MTVDSGAQLSVEFVLNVLRQHEIELDRTSAELDSLVDKIEELTCKLQDLIEQGFNSQSVTKKPLSNTKPC